ncbi:MAG: hypothetical protein ACRDQB_13135, partial [Thermocrispum sp.]
VRTGDREPPAGYRPSDFAVPKLSCVLEAFPDVPVNIEIKGTSDLDVPSFLHNAKLLAELLDKTGRRDVIVTSFNDLAVATPEFVRRAHADGYAVHVWFSGSAPDDEATYNRIIDSCADGLMPAYPSLLERILDERGIERPGRPGVDPCG